MAGSTAVYGSPKVAKAVAMATKSKPQDVQVKMRSSRDVPTFLKRLEGARKDTKQNALQFG